MPSNPPSTPTFSRATTVALIVGAVLAFVELDGPGYSVYGVGAVLGLGVFLFLFARDCLGWFVSSL